MKNDVIKLPLKPEISTEEKQKEKSKIKTRVIIIVALILIATVWIWKEIRINNIINEATNDRQALKDSALAHIAETHEAHMVLLVKPFVWTVRSEMLTKNMNQVNLYANEMVKQKGFQKIVIADEKGTIILSTNKKDEGNQFKNVGDENLISSNTSVINNQNGIMVVSSPIMGFNNKLGTLVIYYKPVIPTLEFEHVKDR